jgi:hypothetical protein
VSHLPLTSAKYIMITLTAERRHNSEMVEVMFTAFCFVCCALSILYLVERIRESTRLLGDNMTEVWFSTSHLALSFFLGFPYLTGCLLAGLVVGIFLYIRFRKMQEKKKESREKREKIEKGIRNGDKAALLSDLKEDDIIAIVKTMGGSMSLQELRCEFIVRG